MVAHWQSEKEAIAHHPHAEGAARGATGRARARDRSRTGRRDPLRRHPRPRASGRRGHEATRRAPGRPADAEGRGRRGRRRRGREQVDRRARQPAHGRRDAQAAAPRRGAARTRRRPGRRGPRGRQRDPSQPRRAVRSAPSDRLVPVPRPDRRGQDRAGAGARRLPVRRRAGHGPHRHERVPGEAHGLAVDRRASGLRRLRRGRPADRGDAGAARTRSCCSTRSRRHIPRSSTCCCNCSTTAV